MSKVEALRRKAQRERERWSKILADAEQKGLSRVASRARRSLNAISHIAPPKEKK